MMITYADATEHYVTQPTSDDALAFEGVNGASFKRKDGTVLSVLDTVRLKSPNGNTWELAVDNMGIETWTDLG